MVTERDDRRNFFLLQEVLLFSLLYSNWTPGRFIQICDKIMTTRFYTVHSKDKVILIIEQFFRIAPSIVKRQTVGTSKWKDASFRIHYCRCLSVCTVYDFTFIYLFTAWASKCVHPQTWTQKQSKLVRWIHLWQVHGTFNLRIFEMCPSIL